LREHLLAHLLCPGRHTVTSLITTFGKQFQDWTADYSLYAQERVKQGVLFRQIRKEVEALLSPSRPLCVAIDDTILRKTGKTIPGTAYRKDPLGPAFNINLVWAQRRLQLSGAVVLENNEVRMVPIGFEDASTPRKPRKNAPSEEVHAYREVMKQRNLNAVAIAALEQLQKARAGECNGIAPALHALLDGSFTNKKVLRHTPENTVVIGRIRKDAKLNKKPGKQPARGRKRIYGEDLPTPEQIRKDDTIAWIKIQVRAAGKWHDFEVKTLAPVRWRAAGEIDLRLVIIRPVGYRLRKGGKLLYRQPAYLICTDVNLSLEDILQEYIWRWDIEVNHRDEKTILGVGQAQVRNEHSVTSVPATAVAAYAMLHLAAIKAYGKHGKPGVIPEALWRDPDQKQRASTQDLINELRRELWATAIRPEILTDFMTRAHRATKSVKSAPDLCSSLFAMTA
jgi:hypothetical protein